MQIEKQFNDAFNLQSTFVKVFYHLSNFITTDNTFEIIKTLKYRNRIKKEIKCSLHENLIAQNLNL